VARRASGTGSACRGPFRRSILALPGVVTSSAETPHVPVPAGADLERVSLRAGGLPGVLCCRPFAAKDVDPERHPIQMARVDAPPVSARVVRVQIRRRGADGQFVGDHMRGPHRPAKTGAPVAVSRGPEPPPAARSGALVHVEPETAFTPSPFAGFERSCRRLVKSRAAAQPRQGVFAFLAIVRELISRLHGAAKVAGRLFLVAFDAALVPWACGKVFAHRNLHFRRTRARCSSTLPACILALGQCNA
jgi:hypothetical protein